VDSGTIWQAERFGGRKLIKLYFAPQRKFAFGNYGSRNGLRNQRSDYCRKMCQTSRRDYRPKTPSQRSDTRLNAKADSSLNLA